MCWCVMLACHYERHTSDLSAVRVSEIARPPPPSPSQLLVRVRAAALNPADWKTAQGEQARLARGREQRLISHRRRRRGSDDLPPFRVGDRVFGMIRLPERDRGSLAEYRLVDAAVCARSPEGARDVDLASLPLVCSTAVRMLRACRLEEFLDARSTTTTGGPRVLVTGGAGGVGSVAIQLAKSLCRASFVATTASAGAKADLCTSLGADQVVDYKSAKFEDVLEHGSFDAILDCTAEAARCVPLLKPGGAIVSILKNECADMLRVGCAVPSRRCPPFSHVILGRRNIRDREWRAQHEAPLRGRRCRNDFHDSAWDRIRGNHEDGGASRRGEEAPRSH